MWTVGWATSKCTQDSQNVCTKSFLYLVYNAKKPSIFRPSANIVISTLSMAPTPVWQHHQHTHETSKNFVYGLVLGPLQFQSTGQNTPFNLKINNFDSSGIQEKFNTPPLKPNQNWAQLQKPQLTPYKTLYAFFRSPSGQGVMPTNLLPVIVPRIEPICTHSHLHKIGPGLQARIKVSFLQ